MTVDAGPWHKIAADFAEELAADLLPCRVHPPDAPGPRCRTCRLNALMAAYRAMESMAAEPGAFPGDPVAYARAHATSPRAVELLAELDRELHAGQPEVIPEAPPGVVLPHGCNGDGTQAEPGQRGRTGCLHHYPGSLNLAAQGCQCPAWFDAGGWHLVEYNPACRSPIHLHLAAN
jgi:hypothetical protein